MNTDLYAEIYAALTAQLRAGLGFLAPVDEADGSTLEVATIVALLESLAPDREADTASVANESEAGAQEVAVLKERIAELEDALAAEREARAELEKQLAAEEVLEFGAVGEDEADQPPVPPSAQEANGEQLRVLIRQLRDVELEVGMHATELSIGRTGANDLQFKDPSVSRRHALLRQSGEVAEIIDCDSRNGVYVNDNKVSRHELCHGDRVTIGTQRFVFICR